MPARARLPENLMNPGLRAEREEILRLHAEGTLYALHKHLAERLCAYEAEIDHTGAFWLADVRVSDNTLWCLLRRDVEALGLPIRHQVIRKVFDISLSHIRKSVRTEPGHRVRIVHEESQA